MDNIIGSIKEYEAEFIKRYNRGERTITILYPQEGKPDMSFLWKYDIKYVEEGGVMTIRYQEYPPRRIGDYTLYTVIFD